MTNVMTPLTTAQISTTFKTDYCGNVIYENGAVSKILTEEGYITLAGTTPTYHYYLKDHQGNNRVVINQAGTVEQVNHYYPFGGLKFRDHIFIPLPLNILNSLNFSLHHSVMLNPSMVR